VVRGAFQSIDCVCFHINQKEVDPELLLKVFLGLDGEDASICFLTEHVFRPLGSTITFEECKSPENSLFFIVKLPWGQVDMEGAGVQKCVAVVIFSAEVRRTGELRMCPSCCQSRRRRHQRRWYRRGRCVWYRQRRGISH